MRKYESDTRYPIDGESFVEFRRARVGDSVVICTKDDKLVAGVVESMRWDSKSEKWVPNVVPVNHERDRDVSDPEYWNRSGSRIEEMPANSWCFSPAR